MTIDPDQAASEADQYMAALNERAIKLQFTGISRSVAFCTAEVETRIARYWPEMWGNDNQIQKCGYVTARPGAGQERTEEL